MRDATEHADTTTLWGGGTDGPSSWHRYHSTVDGRVGVRAGRVHGRVLLEATGTVRSEGCWSPDGDFGRVVETMTPTQARRLAEYLLTAADAADVELIESPIMEPMPREPEFWA